MPGQNLLPKNLMPGQKLTPEIPDAQACTSVPTFIRSRPLLSRSIPSATKVRGGNFPIF